MKKIMFNDKYGLSDAVINGRKTMTRRVCKDMATGEQILFDDVVSWRFYPDDNLVEFIMTDGSVKVTVPPYKVGEVVAVAQSYKECVNKILINLGHKTDIAVMGFKKTAGWNNKMFVKADLMPYRIRITDIRVERLQAISNDDCLRREGLWRLAGTRLWHYDELAVRMCKNLYNTPREAFAALIDKVSGRGTWERNPWVFAYEFELEKGGER